MTPRPPVRQILTEAADTQHTAALTWSEARELLDALDRHAAFHVAVQRVYDLQCPPMPAENYVDRGAHMAHQWWETCLGSVLRDVRYSPGRATEEAAGMSERRSEAAQVRCAGTGSPVANVRRARVGRRLPMTGECPECRGQVEITRKWTAKSHCTPTPPAQPDGEASA